MARQKRFLIATVCSEAPQGRKRWTLELLQDKVIAAGYVDGVAEVRAAGFPYTGVSIGMVALPEEVVTTGDLVRLSDQRMYDDRLGSRVK